MSEAESICFQLTLVRHGETEYNRLRIIQGQRDVELSNVGFSQAELVAKRLASEKFNLIFSSDLSRAKKTADAIVSKLENSVEITTDALLRERGFGEAEGRPLSELIASARQSKLSLIEYTPKGGETHQQLINRTKEFFTSLIKVLFFEQGIPPPTAVDGKLLISNQGSCVGHHRSPALHVLVTTHGGWIHSFIEYLTKACPNISLARGALGISPNTGVTSFLISLSKRQQQQKTESQDSKGSTKDSAEDVLCTAVSSLCVHDASHL